MHDVVAFGPFHLYRRQRVLKCDGEPVKLGGRAFDILLALVDNAGEIVSHKELFARAWPEVFVEEVSLRFQVAALRKALDSAAGGSDYLTTIPGRGYCFVAPISEAKAEEETGKQDSPAQPAYALPPVLDRMVGRDDTVREVCIRTIERRFVTIVGPGGMGKTTVAVSVAHHLLDKFRGAVCFVDLSPLRDPRLLAGTVASAFGLAVQAQDPTSDLLAHLRGKRTLLILDSSEHLISEVANLSQRLFDSSREVHILTTSRETLRAEGEYVYRLPPLTSPPEKGKLTAAETLAFAGPQLFVARMASGGQAAELGTEDALLVGDMCRKLGGIALAIELAARRVETYGIQDTAKLLDSQFALLWSGRRTAPPRHQTLSATLDWSYNLLSEVERAVLRRLSVFRGSFTFDAAHTVAGPSLTDAEIFDGVGGLLTKSLATADSTGATVRYRLLDTTRTYAEGKLEESGEHYTACRQHALYFRDALELAAGGKDAANASAAFRADFDNIRAALDWTMSPHGDAALAVDLAALTVPLWLGKALLTECGDWMAKALALLDKNARPTRQQLVIQTALASALVLTTGFSDESKSIWTETLKLAFGLSDVSAQLAAHTALWGQAIRAPDYEEALRMARSCAQVVKGDPDQGRRALAEWMLGITYHHVGQLDTGRLHLQRALDVDTEESRFTQLEQIGYDRRVPIIGVMANLLWCKGFAVQAQRWAARALEEAGKLHFALPLSVAMTWTCFNRYLSDPDIDAVESDVVEFVEYARTHRIISDQGIALGLLGLCQARRGHYEAGEPLVVEGLRLMGLASYEVLSPIVRAHLCELAIAAGHLDKAVDIMAEAEARDRNALHFGSAEILRVKGVLAAASSDQATAKARFEESIALSRQQGSLAFELRSTMDMSSLLDKWGRGREALQMLRSVFARFSEGFEAADLQRAKGLISSLTSARE